MSDPIGPRVTYTWDDGGRMRRLAQITPCPFPPPYEESLERDAERRLPQPIIVDAKPPEEKP